MKITSKTIHKDIRTIGVIIRKIYRFRNVKQFRACNKILNHFMRGRFPKDIHVEERYILRSNNTKMRILICYSKNHKSNATAVLWIHGGGYALGIPEMDMHYTKAIIENTNSIVILPEYTLSIDKPYPAALEDCYLTLIWIKEHALELGINQDQLFVAGESAGGGLTAALSLYARDKKEVKIAFQMPLYPMLDCRMKTPSMYENDAPVWDYEANKLAWKLYLSELYGNESIPCYASAALALDYNDLPNTYTFVGTIDPFYDETITFIENLKKAGINAKVDIYEGCYHAFDLFGRKKQIGKQATEKWIKEFKYAVENYFVKQL